jgi:hypothetical protein
MDKMICKVCNIEKELSEFPFQNKKSNKYHKHCKKCKAKLCRERAFKKLSEEQKIKFLLKKEKLKLKKEAPPKIKLTEEEKKEKRKKTAREYVRNKKNNDYLFKLKANIRTLISNSITKFSFKKKSKTSKILGCSFEEVKLYFESKFEPWMNWDNYGNPKDGIYEPNKTWDIDHITPTSNAVSEEHLLELNHYTNLQPLCSYYNRFVKSNKL